MLVFLTNSFLLESRSPSGICRAEDCAQSHTSTRAFFPVPAAITQWGAGLVYLHTRSWQLLPWGSLELLAGTRHLPSLGILLAVPHTPPEIPIASQVCPAVPVPWVTIFLEESVPHSCLPALFPVSSSQTLQLPSLVSRSFMVCLPPPAVTQCGPRWMTALCDLCVCAGMHTCPVDYFWQPWVMNTEHTKSSCCCEQGLRRPQPRLRMSTAACRARLPFLMRCVGSRCGSGASMNTSAFPYRMQRAEEDYGSQVRPGAQERGVGSRPQ